MLFQPTEIEQAALLIQRGGIVAFPTETVYGLGASVFHKEAIAKIFQVKKRPQDNPLIIHVADLSQLDLIVKNIPSSFWRLAEAFFPGPLTVLLPKNDSIPESVSAKLPTVGVRMPDHDLARNFIRCCGVPLVAPSANLSGKPSSTTAAHVEDDFGDSIDGIVEGGSCKYGLESTVISLSPYPVILRPGSLKKERIEEVLQQKIVLSNEVSERPSSPGMKYRHYAPKARVVVFECRLAFENYLKASSTKNQMILETIHPECFYAQLRLADCDKKEEIVLFCNEEAQKNVALMNRIHKASQ